jgi:hypothetical protein
VLTSAQAVTMTGVASAPTWASPAVLAAAADIGAHVLHAVAGAVEQGHELRRRFMGLADELCLREPGQAGPIRFDATIGLRP